MPKLPLVLAISYCNERGPGIRLPGTQAELGIVTLPVNLVVNPALISFGIPAMAAKQRATSMSRWIWSEQPQRRLDSCAWVRRASLVAAQRLGRASTRGRMAPYSLAHERRHERYFRERPCSRQAG